jgi:hypothetical protein
MTAEIKLTENEVVNILLEHLVLEGWTILSFCLGQSHGNDIVASKANSILIIEAKGAKASDSSPSKKRDFFSVSQIKTHFGKALVTVLDEKYKNPEAIVGIAHPDDLLIRKTIGHLIPFLKVIGIKHFWISSDKSVIEE